ncbi:MAG: cytochrome d ubiquinol oxidase subunit II [Rhodobacteraceae bacterium]|nr:cytochrome d ubiquinol oxidase subunit II [Paracoccaceae bacterium]
MTDLFIVDLPHVWAALIAFAVFAYVVLDGFDLGIGMLFPLLRDGEERATAQASIAPVWDGNETWLVMGGGGLLAAFPAAYGIVLNALYVPVTAMLLGLVFRGVAFEFRVRSRRRKWLWDIAFSGGSLVAALSQGAILAGLLQKPRVVDGAFAGGPFDWATPFAALVAVALVAGYALLGATWLVLKTEGALQERARRLAQAALALTLAFIGLVSLATPFLDDGYFDRWFHMPGLVFSVLVPGLLALAAWRCWIDAQAGSGLRAYAAAIAVFALCYAGIGISIAPQIVPGSLTIAEAAAPAISLRFLLVGALVLIPLILAYTGFAFWVFRGKVDRDSHY